jgi:hypothetical protein
VPKQRRPAAHEAPNTLSAEPSQEDEKSLIEEFSEEAEKISAVEVLKGFGKGALETAWNVGDVATMGLTHLIETPADKEKREGFFSASNSSQQFGKTAERVTEFLVPMPGLSGIRAATSASMLTNAGIRAGRQAANRAIRSLAETGNAKEAAEAAVTGAMLGALPPVVGELFGNWVRSQYANLVPPLGKSSRKVTRSKLLSGGKGDLVSRGVVAPSRLALMGRFNGEVQNASADVEQAYQQLSNNAQIQMLPVFQSIAKFVNDKATLPNGHVGDPELYTEGLKMMADVTRKLGPVMGDADMVSVREFRQIVNDALFARKLNITPKTTGDRVKKATVNSLKDAINSQHPSVDDINARLRFWETAASVFRAEDADARSKQDVLLSAAARDALSQAFGSTLWPTLSPLSKSRIAGLLASGQGEAAANLAARAVALAIMHGSRNPD